jgi:flavorubredoxin
MKPREIRKDVHWVGAVDWDRRLFDALIPLPDGTSYNAYLVQGSEKTVLLDAVDPLKTDILARHLEAVPKIDYIVAHHAEQDHSGAIPFVMEKYPGAVVLCSEKARPMLIDHLLLPEDRVRAVKDGETVSLGGKTLTFVYTPWVHWPETMSTYLAEDKILFSCDFFGSHLATSDLFVADEERVYEPAKRYYAEIMMPFRKIVRDNLEKVSRLDIAVIAPSHGPLHGRPGFIMDAYRDWAGDTPKNIAVIPWVSMHGSTAKMAEYLVEGLAERGVRVHPFNMEVADIGQLAMSLVDAATVIVGTPTVHVGPHPAVVSAVYLANALRPKARFASVFGSYGWATKTVDVIKGMIPALKVELIEPVICRGYPRDADFRGLDAMADAVAAKHAELGLV